MTRVQFWRNIRIIYARFSMVKFKDLEHPQNIVSLHVQRRNMFWISIEQSIEVAV